MNEITKLQLISLIFLHFEKQVNGMFTEQTEKNRSRLTNYSIAQISNLSD